MRSDGNLIRVILAIFVVASPALTARVISDYFDVEYLQPLAVTSESVEAYEQATEAEGFVNIVVRITWGSEWEGRFTQTGLVETIGKALDHQTEFYRFDFREVQGDEVRVTFYVGPNSYGPFAPDHTVQGVKSALIALKMTNKTDR